MTRCVFMDYTGTIVQEEGREIQEVILRVCKNSDLHDPKAAVALWWKLLKEYEEDSYGDSYLTEDEIVIRLLERLREEIHLRDDREELHELMRGFWVHAPLFPDVAEFFEKCPLPVYVISNNSIRYVGKSLEIKGISPAGIVYADLVRAYKPHREIFDKALEISGCRAQDAVHIGDSYLSDARGALLAGIRPILLKRTGKEDHRDVTVARSLGEALALLEK